MSIIQKSYYINDDLKEVSLHDCEIHGLFYNEKRNQFLLDIDFITKWVLSDGKYSFVKSQSTLVFSNVKDVSIDLDYYYAGKMQPPEIDNLDYSIETNEHNVKFSKYTITSHQGVIIVYSDKVELFLRTKPTLFGPDSLIEGRNSPSFELVCFDRS